MIKSLYKLTFPWIIIDGRKNLLPALLLRIPAYILIAVCLLYQVRNFIWPRGVVRFLAAVALGEGMFLLDVLMLKNTLFSLSGQVGNPARNTAFNKKLFFEKLIFVIFSPLFTALLLRLGGDLIWRYVPSSWSSDAYHDGLNFFVLHAIAMQSILLFLFMIAQANQTKTLVNDINSIKQQIPIPGRPISAQNEEAEQLKIELNRLRYENKILKEDLNSLQQEAIAEEDDKEDFDWWSYLLTDIRDYLDKGSHKGHFWEDVAFEIWPSEEVGEIINWYNVSVSEHQSKVVMEEEWISGSHLLYLMFKERKIAISLNHAVADYDAAIAGLLTVVQPDVELRRCTLLNPPTLLPLAPEDWQEVEIICGKANIERCFAPVLATDRIIADYIKLTNGQCYYGT